MVPSAGSARPQLKRGLMSSARIWLTRSSMMRLLTKSKAPGGHSVGRLYSVVLIYACRVGLSRGAVAAILGGRHNGLAFRGGLNGCRVGSAVSSNRGGYSARL